MLPSSSTSLLLLLVSLFFFSSLDISSSSVFRLPLPVLQRCRLLFLIFSCSSPCSYGLLPLSYSPHSPWSLPSVSPGLQLPSHRVQRHQPAVVRVSSGDGAQLVANCYHLPHGGHCRYVCPSACLSACLSVCLLTVILPACLPASVMRSCTGSSAPSFLTGCLSVCMPLCFIASLIAILPVCLSVVLFYCLPLSRCFVVWQSACWPVRLYVVFRCFTMFRLVPFPYWITRVFNQPINQSRMSQSVNSPIHNSNLSRWVT